MVKALFKTKNLNSVLGTFSINSAGDTTLTSYGLYKLAPDEGRQGGQPDVRQDAASDGVPARLLA